MAISAITFHHDLSNLSPIETKVFIWLLQRDMAPYPETFEINNMELAIACQISLPTASKAVHNLVQKGIIHFIKRPYKTAPGSMLSPKP